jgi:hypothetical protein
LSSPPRHSQGPPTTALQAATPDVRALVTNLGLSADVVLAESLANACFPPDSDVTVEKVNDRESDAEWIAVRVTVRASPDVAGASYTKWLEEWVGAASAAAVDLITLTFSVV